MTLENESEQIAAKLAALTSDSPIDEVAQLLSRKQALEHLMALRYAEAIAQSRAEASAQAEQEAEREQIIDEARRLSYRIQTAENIVSLRNERDKYVKGGGRYNELQAQIDEQAARATELRRELAQLERDYPELYAIGREQWKAAAAA